MKLSFAFLIRKQFTDLSVWMGIRRIIEQVNANAIAA